MKESILKDKVMDFAIRIVNLYKFLSEYKNEKVMSKQVLRSGTSIGANINEGVHAESSADFIHKYAIAQKECSETEYWLELLYKTEYININEYDSINNNCREIHKMITSTIITCKKNIHHQP